jgi:hypothetical protein
VAGGQLGFSTAWDAYAMKTEISVLTCLSALAAGLILGGCVPSTEMALADGNAGKACTIQFRRDALGAAASVPIAPTTGSFNGAPTTISGTLKSSRGDWVVITREDHDIWVPKQVILLVQF